MHIYASVYGVDPTILETLVTPTCATYFNKNNKARRNKYWNFPGPNQTQKMNATKKAI